MKNAQRKRSRVIQNLGWADRVVRIIIGTVLVVVPLTIIAVKGPLSTGTSVSGWLYFSMLLALYPFLTSTFGWDPAYTLFKIRSCGDAEGNPCGTLPYELDAAVGRRPIPESEVIHSLGTAHHASDKNVPGRRSRP